MNYNVIMKKIRRRYNPVRYYKKFKSEYLYFVLFIKCGEKYYTYDSDAKIMMYIFCEWNSREEFVIKKENFSEVVGRLHKSGINVVLAGSKNVKEYYTDKKNSYLEIKKAAKEYYKSTKSGVNN